MNTSDRLSTIPKIKGTGSFIALYNSMEPCQDMTLQLTAAQKVFAVRELLESILLLLPTRDLLLSQRVNRFFRNTITGSSLLQEALFLRATPADSDGIINRDPEPNRILTEFIESHYDCVFEIDGRCYSLHEHGGEEPLRVFPYDVGVFHQFLDVRAYHPLPRKERPTISPSKFCIRSKYVS